MTVKTEMVGLLLSHYRCCCRWAVIAPDATAVWLEVSCLALRGVECTTVCKNSCSGAKSNQHSENHREIHKDNRHNNHRHSKQILFFNLLIELRAKQKEEH